MENGSGSETVIAMIQAEIGGAARVDTGVGVQRPGFMIRDFTLISNRGDNVRISSFRGRSNLLVAFPGYSDATCAFLAELVRHDRKFSDQDTTVLVVVPYGPKERPIPIPIHSPIAILHDETLYVHRLSGATDENGCLMPIVYLTDRFGEIISTYVEPDHLMPPSVVEIFNHTGILESSVSRVRTARMAAIARARNLEVAGPSSSRQCVST